MSDQYDIEVLDNENDRWVLVATAPGFVRAISILIDTRAASNATTRLTIR